MMNLPIMFLLEKNALVVIYPSPMLIFHVKLPCQFSETSPKLLQNFSETSPKARNSLVIMSLIFQKHFTLAQPIAPFFVTW